MAGGLIVRFETGRVQLGSMLFPSELPSGQLPVAPATCCLVFPRRSAWIDPDDGPAFVADATTVLAVVQRTRALLGASYTVNVSLAEIARHVECSPFHLCRMFKRHTGYTIHQYRTQLRLRHSLELLEREPSDILNTAIQLGFSGHSQYTKAFHLAFGITPSVFSRTPPRTPYATVFSQGQLSL